MGLQGLRQVCNFHVLNECRQLILETVSAIIRELRRKPPTGSHTGALQTAQLGSSKSPQREGTLENTRT